MEMKSCEEYIDIEFVSASSSFLCFYNSSPPHSTEFEFHKLSASHDSDSTPSPADELFYRGKLLPLHLPPRLQMVEKLHNSSKDHKKAFEGQNNNPFTEISMKPASANKLFSPSESRRVCVSSELSSDEFFFGWSTEMRSFMNDHPEKCWSRNLKKIKQSLFGQRLKASRVFLKSLFGKSGCTDDSCAKAAHNNAQSRHVSHKKRLIRNGNCNDSAAIVKQNGKEMTEDVVNTQRRSFSGAINWTSATNNKCLSSSSSGSTSSSWSASSDRFYDLQLLTRSNSFNLEIENPIDGAISHCKKSQKLS